jgi:hypothetical protein
VSETLSVSLVAWPEAYRIISSRFPPIDLFERVAPPADWEGLTQLEMLTNPRLRESYGEISIVPVDRRVAGPGATYVMAPFAHPRPSRFSDGGFGVYYAGREFETALRETVHHAEAFFKDTPALYPRSEDYRVLRGKVEASLHDLRPAEGRFYLDPNDYGPARELGRRLRDAGSDGVAYPSARNAGGECIGAFWPDVVGIPIQTRHLRYHFDGARISRYFDYAAEIWIAL